MAIRKTVARGGAAATVAVPRLWLTALIGFAAVPWLIAAALYGWDRAAAARDDEPVDATAVTPSSVGRWGQLTSTAMVISPPLEYVSIHWGPIAVPEWHFPGASAEEVARFLAAAGLAAEDVSHIRSAIRLAPDGSGVVMRPDPAVVSAMDPQVRARIYTVLAKSPRNVEQVRAFRYLGASIDDWLGSSRISPRIRQLVDPLVYRDGEYLYFADIDRVRSQIPDGEELRRLAKALLRQSTVRVTLSIPDAGAVEGLADYWGRGGRRTDIRPILESMVGADPGRSLDIVHLLPAFARDLLYRYPKLTTADLERPVLANCLWTALNFFSAEPDVRLLDLGFALERLKHDYYIVEHGYQLGDIVALVDRKDQLFHVAVVLADDLVFSKNGMSPVAPWIILPINQLKGYYRSRSETPQTVYHRRRDF